MRCGWPVPSGRRGDGRRGRGRLGALAGCLQRLDHDRMLGGRELELRIAVGTLRASEGGLDQPAALAAINVAGEPLEIGRTELAQGPCGEQGRDLATGVL